VPVPIGFYVASFVAAFMSLREPRDAFWPRAWRLTGTAAVVSSAGAAVVGLVDFLTLVRTSGARAVGLAHMMLNSSALGLQFWALQRGRDDRRQRLWLQSGVLALVSAAGFAGGDLTYRHRIGVFGRPPRRRDRPPRSNASYYVPATD
jgi:uncharacterized membrane protein